MLLVLVQGYSVSGQTQYAMDGLRWVADYFVKCHHKDVAYTGQVTPRLATPVQKHRAPGTSKAERSQLSGQDK